MKHQIIAYVLLALVCHQADGAVPGRITLTNDQSVAGMLMWQPASKTYRVIGGNLVLPLSKIKSVQVKEPDHLELALKMIERGDYTQPIPILLKITEEYTMLQWDQPAYRWLAECYLRTGQPSKVLAVYTKASRLVAHPHPDILPLYLEALLDLGEIKRVEQMLKHVPQDELHDLRKRLKEKRGTTTTKSTLSSEAAPSAAPSER